ncbi:MAG: helix-turn-helix domain-containing protein [Capsulimonas sp.]|uniref:helix-turn-helix domain-containing protein n=1 Tax=Capsulimonas sp. TaxID=2494211 RepID=UPI003266FC50
MEQFDPSRSDFSPYGLTVERWIASVMPRPDRHNEIEINLLESGRLTYLFGGERVTVRAGQISVFWAAVPHQIIDIDGASPYYVVTIPLALFLQWNMPRVLADSVLHGLVMSGDSEDDKGDIALLQRWRHSLERQEPEWRQLVLLEMQARLLRLALEIDREALASPARPALNVTILSKAEEIAAYIAKNYLRPITVREIGDAVGLHPNYAMSLYKATFASTMTATLTQYRLSHAQRLLATTNQNILNIALEAGFGSLSRFNEAFRQEFNSSPRDYRKQHRM